jgi:hypothetical protein
MKIKITFGEVLFELKVDLAGKIKEEITMDADYL